MSSDAAKLKAQAEKKDKFCEACYDGELPVVEKMLNAEIGLLLECTDSELNTPLCAAANGQQLEVCQLLIAKLADPNHVGDLYRTPLFRAAFCGADDVVEFLLNNGGNPWISDKSGELPVQVAPEGYACEKLLNKWTYDAEFREQAEAAIEDRKNQVTAARDSRKKEHLEKFGPQIDECNAKIAEEVAKLGEFQTAAFEAWKAWVSFIFKGLNTIIYADDPAVVKEDDPQVIALFYEVQKTKGKLMEATRELRVLEKELEKLLDDGTYEGQPGACDGGGFTYRVLPLKQLSDAMIKDIGDFAVPRFKKDGRTSNPWPLLWDPSSTRATTFFSYSGGVMLDVYDIKAMRNFRRTMLHCLKVGIPFVLNIGEAPVGLEYLKYLFSLVPLSDTPVGPGAGVGAGKSEIIGTDEALFDRLMSRELVDDYNFMSLVNEKFDGAEWMRHQYSDESIEKFKLLIVTMTETPNKDLMKKFTVLKCGK